MKKFFLHIVLPAVFLTASQAVPALAQHVKPDTLTEENDSSFYDVEYDSLEQEMDILTPDFMFIPSDVLYDRSWDNLNVRVRRQDFSEMEDTIELLLAHPAENAFIFPKTGKFLSPFGYRGRHFHAGVDIKLDHGDTVVCAWDGKVRLARRYRGYGNLVVVRHFNGLETVYSHLSKMLVSVNQDIKAGEVIGLGGRTGRATTNHLHFETRFLGEPFDPMRIIDQETFRLKTDTVHITAEFFQYRGNKKKKAPAGSQGGDSLAGGHPDPVYHTVRKGDTLSSIARRHGTSVQHLCKLNHITTRTILKLGRRLKVR